jgi:hypothetical protein
VARSDETRRQCKFKFLKNGSLNRSPVGAFGVVPDLAFFFFKLKERKAVLEINDATYRHVNKVQNDMCSYPTHFCSSASLPHFRCTQLHSFPRRRIAKASFPRHIRLFDPSLSFILCPTAPTLNPVPTSVLLCGALSSIAILPCTLLSPLLCRLTGSSSQC